MRPITLFGLVAFTVIGLFLTPGCTQSERDVKAIVESQGYTQVEKTGWGWLECGSGKNNNESFRTKFTAKSPNGSTVRGAVCKGWFKGATVRINSVNR